jgi:hypothetical protein
MPISARAGRTVLSSAAATGRILLPLMAQGIDAVGLDASGRCSRSLRARRVTWPGAAHLRAMYGASLSPQFMTVLAPYSLPTYMATAEDLAALGRGSARCAAARRRLVLDAFVPRPLRTSTEFTEDYRRPFGAFTLVRSKRISARDDGTNRIERRYALVADRGIRWSRSRCRGHSSVHAGHAPRRRSARQG